MLNLMDFHSLTLVVVMAAMMMVPLYTFAIYTQSGASARKGAIVASAFLAFGAVATWVCLTDATSVMGSWGALVVPLSWATPSLLLIMNRRWFLSDGLSQHWLVGMQTWRMIGGVFLIEMGRGNIPGIFAYPAGIGDLAVGGLAVVILLRHRGRPIPQRSTRALIYFGMADFVVAFFFGLTSNEGVAQLFHPDPPSQLQAFPTGLIPQFLVPFAIFCHTLSWLMLRRTPEQGSCSP